MLSERKSAHFIQDKISTECVFSEPSISSSSPWMYVLSINTNEIRGISNGIFNTLQDWKVWLVSGLSVSFDPYFSVYEYMAFTRQSSQPPSSFIHKQSILGRTPSLCSCQNWHLLSQLQSKCSFLGLEIYCVFFVKYWWLITKKGERPLFFGNISLSSREVCMVVFSDICNKAEVGKVLGFFVCSSGTLNLVKKENIATRIGCFAFC